MAGQQMNKKENIIIYKPFVSVIIKQKQQHLGQIHTTFVQKIPVTIGNL